eukprot:2432645-Lingulodinium_polyedra.AAC.1
MASSRPKRTVGLCQGDDYHGGISGARLHPKTWIYLRVLYIQPLRVVSVYTRQPFPTAWALANVGMVLATTAPYSPKYVASFVQRQSR